MDLVYIPEVLTYGSFRSPQYRDYEQPWNRDYFNYGKSTTSIQQQRAHQQHYPPQQKSTSKDSCLLCRESKRRSLAAYIRGKSRRTSCHEIHEEEEENETLSDGEGRSSIAESLSNESKNEDERVSGQM